MIRRAVFATFICVAQPVLALSTDITPYPEPLIEMIVGVEDPDFFQSRFRQSPILRRLLDNSGEEIAQLFDFSGKRNRLINLIQNNFDHREVLAAMLSTQNFGNGCIGPEDAALGLLGKPLADLQAGEFVLLVSLLDGADILVTSPQRLLWRIRQSARDLGELGLIRPDLQVAILSLQPDELPALGTCRS